MIYVIKNIFIVINILFAILSSSAQLCTQWLTEDNCTSGKSLPLYYTRNSKPCWDFIVNVPSLYRIEIVSEFLWYAYDSNNGTILKSINKGQSWIHQGFAIWEQENNGILRFVDSNIGYFNILKSKLYKTIDAGKSWKLIYNNNNLNNVSRNSFDCEGNNIIITYGENAFISTDGGMNYNSQPNQNFNTQSIRKSIILDEKKAIVMTSFNVFVTLDSGKTWRPLSNSTFIAKDISKHDKTFYIVLANGIMESKDGTIWKTTNNRNALNSLTGPLLVLNNEVKGLKEMWIGSDYSIDNGCLTNHYGFDNVIYYHVGNDNSVFMINNNAIYEYTCSGEKSPHDVPFTARTINVLNTDLTVSNESSSHGINSQNNQPTCWVSSSNFERPYWFHFKGNGKNVNLKIKGNDRIKVSIYSGFLNCNAEIFCRETANSTQEITTSYIAQNGKDYFLVVDQNNLGTFNIKLNQTTSVNNDELNNHNILYYNEGKIYITDKEIELIHIYTLTGQILNTYETDDIGIIDIVNYNSGVYVLLYKKNNTLYSKKIVHI